MILLDANILLYAHVEELPQHPMVSRWLEDLLSYSRESTAVAWIGLTAFLRIASSKKIFKNPWTIGQTTDRITTLLAHPMVQVIGPTERHWSVYSELLTDTNLSGDVIMDCHIAAIAVEHNASVASADRDFRRFADYLKIIDPLRMK